MKLQKELLVGMLRQMLLIRAFEDTWTDVRNRGEGLGICALSIGQEAVAVGTCANLKQDDIIASNHRGNGHLIAKGADLKAIFAEAFGKRTGPCKGKGGTLHFTDMGSGILPTAAIVGVGIPIAVGVGLSIKRRQSGQVVVCFFGDGASNIGFFHEGLNFASIHKVPVVFVCENNEYALSMHQKKSMAVENIADRAASYGIPGAVVDGNDVISVYTETRRAVNWVRKGKGPIMVECKTYRIFGHHHGDVGRGIKYRSQEEMDEWAKRDPIKHHEERLLADKIISESEIDQMKEDVANQIEEAVAFAKESPFPEPEEALDGLFAN